jgi:pectinesterase
LRRSYFFILYVLILFSAVLNAEQKIITVSKDGNGDFKTITEAVASLPMFNYERTIIYIKNGVYNEKLKIEQDYVTLRGEDREKTIIRYSQLRTDWLKNKDSIGAAVINLSGDDVILENLTVENSQPEIGPHAFAVYGTGTRTVFINCNFISKGGDTVSLWNYKTGMYYHSNCFFQGAVDFVCPRGWCFIKDSRFYEMKNTASIWHAGGYDADQKFVIRNSSFDGVPGFELGRHHYDAQFYLIDCSFSANLADKSIYRVVYADSTQNRPFNWGKRYYYYNCHRQGGDYDWFNSANHDSKETLNPDLITASWTFDNKWDPEGNKGPHLISSNIKGDDVFLAFNEPVTVIKQLSFTTPSGIEFNYITGSGSNTLQIRSKKHFTQKDIIGITITKGSIIGNIASVEDRYAALDLGKK